MSEREPPVTARLAAFVSGYPAGGVPPEATAQVRRAALDLLGVIVAGSAEPAGRRARAYATTQAGNGPAAVIGGGVRCTPALAALANGTAGHALDYDDIGLGAGHVSVSIMPAALAVAEFAGATGAQFGEAMVLGYEVASRLSRVAADAVSGPYAYGFHKPSVYAVFGGAAATARLLGLDTAATGHALGIAASQTGGLRVNFGTMTKPLHAGVANRTAVEAALLAQAGFTASPTALEGRFGWHDAIARGDGDLGLVLDGLGEERFAVEEGFVFKRFPCCGANHHAIDAVLGLVAEHDLTPDDVAEIAVRIEARYLDEVLVYPWPTSGLEGKFSLAYNVAAALMDRAVTIDTFTDERVAALAPARERVRVLGDPELSRDAAVVTVRTADGRELHRDQRVLRGSLADPLSWTMLVEKFVANTGGFLKEADSAEVVDRLEHLEEQASLASLTELLVGQP
ncbi:MAG: MmgE/PrpD family protein [Acidimicrobiia bacterium]